MKIEVILTTERLVLRPICESDFDAVHSYASVPENVVYMVWGPNSEQDTRNFIKSCVDKWNADPINEYEFAVTLDGSMIGACGIYLNEARDTAMLGWILHRDYWRHGYISEAASALLDYCFNVLKLHRVYATCNAENYASYRAMEKIGMRREAHFVSARRGRVGDCVKWYDEYHYAILNEKDIENENN